MTKMGRLVKDGKIGSLEEIFLFTLPVKDTVGLSHMQVRIELRLLTQHLL